MLTQTVTKEYVKPQSAQADIYSTENQIRGKVSRLFCAREGFCTGKIRTKQIRGWDNECKFKCDTPLRMNEEVILKGKWHKDAKFGWQFIASAIEYPMPNMDAAGIENYLANNPAFRGIGPAKAKLIADAFGDNFDTVIRESPQAIADVAKLTTEQISLLQCEWIKKSDVNAIATWLAAYGLTHSQITRIAERYGNRAKNILTENPYLLQEMHGFGFARTDEIALKMGIAKDNPYRIKSFIAHLVKSEADEGGHTWIYQDELLRIAVGKLAFDCLNAKQLIATQIDELIADGILKSMNHKGSVILADRHIYDKETALICWFIESAYSKPQQVCNTCIEELIYQATQGKANPNAQQRDSVAMALNNRISIMTGSAGTGKSFTIATIRKIFTNLGKSVAMAAPTGKAAKRMSQLAEGAEASTIHKLLGYSFESGGFKYNKNNKLPQDLIIIDESSMCGINLTHSLFSAIDPRRTQVLLVGDHQQLPSIEPGNILRDALTTGIIPHTLLTECIRAGGELKANCNAILAGKINKTTKSLPAGGREWHLINTLDDATQIIESLKLLMQSKFTSWGFDPISECQIITPQNKGPLGVLRINAELQRCWQATKYNRALPEVPADEKKIRTAFYAGDKVMQIKNDYQIDVMNGTQGIIREITRTNSGKEVMIIDFDDAAGVEVEVGSDQAKNVVLAYAISCHKSQGSEYPCVVAIIHSLHSYMLARNLMYTAVTRARKTAILIGNRKGMQRAASTTKAIERRTLMSLVPVAQQERMAA